MVPTLQPLVDELNSTLPAGHHARVLLTMPLVLIGAAVGLYAMQANFGFMVILGLLSLAGIIVNNGIVLNGGMIDEFVTVRQYSPAA